VTKEADRESRRAAESQGGTTITIGAVTPLAISTSPESGPEGSALLLPSLDDLPTLREMLGLPDRESSPEEVDDDDGLKRCFGCPQMESPPNGLRPSSAAPSLRLPPQSLCPLLPPKSLCLLPPPQSLRSLPLPLPLPLP
jgi:hypothetical protein